MILASGDFDELATRDRLPASGSRSPTRALAGRVEQVRDEVRRELKRVADAEGRGRRLQRTARRRPRRNRRGARSGRGRRRRSCSRSPPPARPRSPTLKAQIGELGRATSRRPKRAEAERKRAEAEDEVGRWLGGPYSIPTYIVMCESGGNYGAVNPSSGAGGAYQILPSTWELYGGQGEPQNAPKAEQDRIAAEIWADSGAGAWVCAG